MGYDGPFTGLSAFFSSFALACCYKKERWRASTLPDRVERLFSSGKDFVCGSTIVSNAYATAATDTASAVGVAAATAVTTDVATSVVATAGAGIVVGAACRATAAVSWVRRGAVNFTNSIILARAVVAASWPVVAGAKFDLLGEIVVQIVNLGLLGYCIFGDGLER